MIEEKGMPKVRFQEFDDYWDKVKLKDISERITRKNTNKRKTYFRKRQRNN